MSEEHTAPGEPAAPEEPSPHSAPDGSALTVRTGPLSYAVFALARAHRALAAALLRDLGLHTGQELLLMQLLDRDGQTQSELLASVGTDHSTVSKALRRMQEAGLLRREPAPHDRRVQQVFLTDRGRALRGPLEEMWARLEEVTTADLTPGQIDTFVTLARTIEHSLRPAPASAPGQAAASPDRTSGDEPSDP